MIALKNNFLLRIAFGLCVFSIQGLEGQTYHETERSDFTESGLYKKGQDKYQMYFSFTNSVNDTVDGNRVLMIDTNLRFISDQLVTSPFLEATNLYHEEGWQNKVFLSFIDSNIYDTSNTGFTFFRAFISLGILKNDTTILKTHTLGNDTIYSFEGFLPILVLGKRQGKIFMAFGFQRRDSLPGNFVSALDFCYLDLSNDSLVHLGEMQRTFIEPFFGDTHSGRIVPSGDILDLPDGSWLLEFSFSQGLTSYKYIGHMSPEFDTIYQVWPTRNFGFLNGSHLWRSGNTVYHYSSGSRLDPNYPNQVVDDIMIEKFNMKRDTFIQTHWIELRDTNGQFTDGATDGAYFNGEHFVLSGWSELNPGSFFDGPRALDIFTLDTNFKLLHHKTITDSSFSFNGRIQSIIPKIGDSSKVVYSGYARNPSVHPRFNLFWGEYSILGNTVGLEAPLKVQRKYLQIYPNPSTGIVRLVNQRFENQPYVVKIVSINGKLLSEHTFHEAAVTLSIEQKPGVYLLQLEQDNYREVQRVYIR